MYAFASDFALMFLGRGGECRGGVMDIVCVVIEYLFCVLVNLWNVLCKGMC